MNENVAIAGKGSRYKVTEKGEYLSLGPAIWDLRLATEQ